MSAGQGSSCAERARAIEHRQMRGAGIEPHVQNVGFLAPARRAARTARARGQQLLRRVREPRVRALSREPFARRDAAPRNRQTACRTCRNTESPAARPRIAAAKRTSPAAPRSSSESARAPHSGVHFTLEISRRARAARRRFRRAHVRAPGVELDEPLFGGAENHRIVAPPAVRIAVRKFSLAEQARRATSSSAITAGFASKTVFPLYSGKPSRIGRGRRSARTPRCHISGRSESPQRRGPARCARCRCPDRA